MTVKELENGRVRQKRQAISESVHNEAAAWFSVDHGSNQRQKKEEKKVKESDQATVTSLPNGKPTPFVGSIFVAGTPGMYDDEDGLGEEDAEGEEDPDISDY
jgi:hypothetical protein